MIRLYFYSDNFGDELSPYIVNKLTNEEVRYNMPFTKKAFTRNLLACIKHCCNWPSSTMIRNMSFTRHKVFFAVGSLIENSTDNCVIWGTGIARESAKIAGGRFIMTRGPMSRKIVEENGFNVENKIGADPALLMPLLYEPKTRNKKAIGLICHNVDYKQISKLPLPDYVNLICLYGSDVESVVDKINECSLVFTTSLHGLIVSHAYGINACWIEREPLPGGHFKFHDYLMSVGIYPYEPIPLKDIIEKDFMIEFPNQVCTIPTRDTIKGCQKALLENFPFIIVNKQYIWNQL